LLSILVDAAGLPHGKKLLGSNSIKMQRKTETNAEEKKDKQDTMPSAVIPKYKKASSE